MSATRVILSAVVITAKVLWYVIATVLVVGFTVLFVFLGFCLSPRGMVRRTRWKRNGGWT